jgi:hypothetical protein
MFGAIGANGQTRVWQFIERGLVSKTNGKSFHGLLCEPGHTGHYSRGVNTPAEESAKGNIADEAPAYCLLQDLLQLRDDFLLREAAGGFSGIRHVPVLAHRDLAVPQGKGMSRRKFVNTFNQCIGGRDVAISQVEWDDGAVHHTRNSGMR